MGSAWGLASQVIGMVKVLSREGQDRGPEYPHCLNQLDLHPSHHWALSFVTEEAVCLGALEFRTFPGTPDFLSLFSPSRLVFCHSLGGLLLVTPRPASLTPSPPSQGDGTIAGVGKVD